MFSVGLFDNDMYLEFNKINILKQGVLLFVEMKKLRLENTSSILDTKRCLNNEFIKPVR